MALRKIRKGFVVWIGIAAVVGLGCGEFLRRRLNRLAYRLEADPDSEETAETDLPAPGRRWWIPLVLAAGWAGIVWASAPETWSITESARLVSWLGFATIGLWLSAIDLDVQRLPDSGQLWLAAVTVVGGVVVDWDHPARLLVGLAAGCGCALLFWLIHLFSRGGLGLGDVKLVATCAWWLGLFSLTAVYAAIGIGCLLGLAYSLVTRTRSFAFGPWLIAGTLVAGLVLV